MTPRGLTYEIGAFLARRPLGALVPVAELAEALQASEADVLAAARDVLSGHLVRFDVWEDAGEVLGVELLRPTVVIESPYAGDVEDNTRYARACLRDSLTRGEAPLASHLLYTQPGVLDDLDPEERTCGIAAGLAWPITFPHVFYTDRGWSRGMELALSTCRARNTPTHLRTLGHR